MALAAEAGSLKDLLTRLATAVNQLPSTLPKGQEDGPLALHFSSTPVDVDEGPWYSCNHTWERVFHSAKPRDDQLKLMTRGSHGLKLCYKFLKFYADHEGMSNSDKALLAGKIEALLALVSDAVNNAPARTTKSSQSKLKQATLAGSSTAPTAASKKRTRTNDDDAGPDESDDDDFVPSRRHELPDDHETNSEEERQEEESLRKLVMGRKGKNASRAKPAGGKAKPKTTARKKRRTAKAADSGSSGEESVIEISGPEDEDIRVGRRGDKSIWAATNFTCEPSKKNGNAVWKWLCKYCRSLRTSPRSSWKIKTFDARTEGLTKHGSNLISHLERDCTALPANAKFEAWKAIRDGKPLPPELESAAPSGIAASRAMMQSFSEQGLANPAHKVTPRGFREVFTKGVIEDDLPFTFGSKGGMKKTFQFILPKGYKVPGPTMIRRDLDLLHGAIYDQKIKADYDAHTGKIAASCDGWGSKSSVFSFIGVVTFHINRNWELVERPLALLPLDEDHSGKVYAKEVFSKLRECGVARKLIANTSDNTSANGVMNRGICKRAAKAHGTHLNPVNMDIGCGAHVIALSCSEIMHGLGLGPSPEKVDWFTEAKANPLVYNPEDDEDYVEEARLQAEELAQEEKEGIEDDDIAAADVLADDADSSSSDDDDWDDVDEQPVAHHLRTPSQNILSRELS